MILEITWWLQPPHVHVEECRLSLSYNFKEGLGENLIGVCK